MKTISKIRWTLLASTALTLVLGSGCSDDGDENPNPNTTNVIGGTKGDGGSSNKAGTGGKAGSTANEGGNDPGTGGTGGSDGGSAPVAGAGGEGGTPPEECTLPETGADGCFNCPKTGVQYLNRCADGDCVEFDNSRLTKLNADGSLPELDQ